MGGIGELVVALGKRVIGVATYVYDVGSTISNVSFSGTVVGLLDLACSALVSRSSALGFKVPQLVSSPSD